MPRYRVENAYFSEDEYREYRYRQAVTGLLFVSFISFAFLGDYIVSRFHLLVHYKFFVVVIFAIFGCMTCFLLRKILLSAIKFTLSALFIVIIVLVAYFMLRWIASI